jgi:hypothetical protein
MVTIPILAKAGNSPYSYLGYLVVLKKRKRLSVLMKEKLHVHGSIDSVYTAYLASTR